jgi:general secretion pathway protein B
VSFILDALRKSEHERQRSSLPGLSQVPVATPQPQLPRWAIVVMGALAGVVLVLGAAWWQSTRTPAEPAGESAQIVERSIELPRPTSAAVPQYPVSSRAAAPNAFAPAPAPSLAGAAGAAAAQVETTPAGTDPPAAAPSSAPSSAPARLDVPTDGVTLPSAAALAAEGIAVPPLRLELHAFSSRPHERFVFINGRKYVEGERLVEGPQVVSIAPTGAVLAHAGRQFLLVQD